MQKILLPVVAVLGLATGCYTQGDVGVAYSASYAAPAPSMYYVSDGVSVVAYSDYPVFYSDGYYWRYDNGLWYSSAYYGGGWAVSYNVPYRVRTIDRPYRYARYQPGRWSRPYPQGGTYVRDQRSYGRYQPAYRQPPPASRQPAPTYRAPAVRDQRTPRYTAPAPTYRAPATRDQRTPASAPAPARAPTVRDHRR